MNYQPSAPEKIYNKINHKVIFRKTIMLIILLCMAVMFIPWQQTVYGDGQVVAYSPGERKQVISAPISGLIDKWYVNEGSIVKRGDKIVQLRDQDPQLLNRLHAEKTAIEMQIALSNQAVSLALINVNRQEELYKKGIAGRREYEKAKFDHAKYLSDVAKFEVEFIKSLFCT